MKWLNFDGFVKDDNYVSFSFVVRDSLGNLLFAATKNNGKSKVLIAGAMVLRETFLAVKHYQYNQIFFGRDSKILIDRVNGTCSTPWCIKMPVQDIKTLIRLLKLFISDMFL